MAVELYPFDYSVSDSLRQHLTRIILVVCEFLEPAESEGWKFIQNGSDLNFYSDNHFGLYCSNAHQEGLSATITW